MGELTMKNRKTMAFLLAMTLLLSIAGCASNEINPVANLPIDEHGRKDTPVRVGESIINSSHSEKEYSLSDIIEEADVIADITIIEWLGEYTEDIHMTFFLAKVNKTLKGKVFEEIEIAQLGSSKSVPVDSPLFKNGDRLLAFMGDMSEAAEMHGDDFKGKHRVWGKRFLDVVNHESSFYLLNRGGVFDQILSKNKNVENITEGLKVSINEEFRKNDPIVAEALDLITESDRDDPQVEKFLEEENKRKGMEPVPKENRSHRDIFDYDDVVKVVLSMVKDGEKQ
jgi:hypothetical protein